MHAVIIAPLSVRPHCWQVRPRTTCRITLLTATVQNEILSNNSVTALYMLYRENGDPVTAVLKR